MALKIICMLSPGTIPSPDYSKIHHYVLALVSNVKMTFWKRMPTPVFQFWGIFNKLNLELLQIENQINSFSAKL